MKSKKTSSSDTKTLLTRGVHEIVDEAHLKKRLKIGKPLRVKLGIDPTSPNIHLGRVIPLLKLRDFQEMGHKVILIIGDFTGLIGDTSDKESERPMLTEDQVALNAKTYIEQAGKIIDIKSAEIYYNREWLSDLRYMDIGRQADIFSINEFISRENIAKRLKSGKRVSLREVLYPLMQGYDSVRVKADVEIGGTDQRFNLLAGRDLQRLYSQEPQDIITNPLIEGLDGRKMSSSYGNTINLTDSSDDMFGKVMSLKDDLIIQYFNLLTRINLGVVEKYEKELKSGTNPRDIKLKLAFEITKIFHGEDGAKSGQKNFEQVIQSKKTPSDVEDVFVSKAEMNIVDLLVFAKLAASKSEARRLIEQKAIKIDGEAVTEISSVKITLRGFILQRGVRRFARVSKAK
ncbi:MAG: tyrosine--tRNA ligase [Candidatus Harrisonbacteria bacterium CG10_big_fil_rev_8_21_14_0_10_40_38]|uniref:Tyrosine--tRNA ligase n=1 Tax=Candidatus Harrisonbacteria bacterium CG10_big_fil_rev_8_21_14_0_10_40_38 TaxID=1974583 RepID=A0A2H0UV03_9BACT|nr:MAG: tyrosine--tRNA ligase [Candidatus Harrisonbacteria bacterium CG10_big_fil_rev_8_21_14_0_10_40_38]